MMVLNSYRKEADSILVPIAERMSGINPNTLSWLAFISAVLAGFFFFLSSPVFVFLGTLMVFSNAFFDATDGKVAKITGKTSKRGDFLDHALDRYADIFIIGGISFSSLCRLPIGFFGILGVLMTSYMGTQAHAVGAGRNYGGITGRADRLVLLITIPLIYLLLLSVDKANFTIFGITIGVFEFLMIWFAIAGHLTALYRGIATWRDLK